jgi:hypothetical protein
MNSLSPPRLISRWARLGLHLHPRGAVQPRARYRLIGRFERHHRKTLPWFRVRTWRPAWPRRLRTKHLGLVLQQVRWSECTKFGYLVARAVLDTAEREILQGVNADNVARRFHCQRSQTPRRAAPLKPIGRSSIFHIMNASRRRPRMPPNLSCASQSSN